MAFRSDGGKPPIMQAVGTAKAQTQFPFRYLPLPKGGAADRERCLKLPYSHATQYRRVRTLPRPCRSRASPGGYRSAWFSLRSHQPVGPSESSVEGSPGGSTSGVGGRTGIRRPSSTSMVEAGRSKVDRRPPLHRGVESEDRWRCARIPGIVFRCSTSTTADAPARGGS